ncbi:MFS transporter [Streptomyces mangrovisoli]|uniref:MFS transporter n=1 Tax=Streptomyces mangrovisoli TaxID=1428628 RepID=UPI0009A0CD97|nr:MFS transporter [Streptomyces mangrovisoli]
MAVVPDAVPDAEAASAVQPADSPPASTGPSAGSTPASAVPSAGSTPASAVPSADPEPASGRLVLGLALAQFGVMLSLLTPVMVTLALRVDQIVPKDERGTALGQVLSLGAVLALIGNPVFGSLSDRTRVRFGRRRPWLVGGMAVGLAGLLVVAVGGSVPVLLLGWALAQLGGNAALAATVASIPDLVPARQQGKVSGLVGVTTSLAMVVGTLLANALHDRLALAFVVPGLFGLAGTICLALVMKDRPAAPGAFAPYSLREFLRSFWVSPKRHPDFAWNFAGRFLVFTGVSCVTSYQVYFLMDRLGYSESEVSGKVAVGTVVMVGAVIIGSLLGGTLSDRSGRRKPYVLGASLVLAVGLLLVALAHSFSLFLVAVAVFGFGEGLYLSVDVALAAAVLPNPEESAKDMGVLNIGNALPQSLVPILAPALLAIGGGDENYGALFLFGGVACVLGALAVQFIRSVK